ncbi:glycosyltransferase family 4 protein [Waterburya agarophytonicola K14]|uniref:Glycosyltransferase family 4 protein n=1 Tax=Waterburya agarophytonicola KI4 TaxID=2874699 RepID=A0A964BR58_9CYAN|nr:glycosyltransferase family 4 protein [Waterburya agarophytonicola]MCC0177247.1 glycosyltransferase family 4 protein [Waterburya agarophytonicola KI4]
MDILWFSPTPSHPQNAGNRSRIYALVKYFQNQGHHITFTYFAQESIDSQAIAAMEAEWDDFHLIPTKHKGQKSLGDLWGIDDWYDRNITDEIGSLLRKKSFDVVFCEYIFQSKVLELFPPQCIKVIDTHDRFGDRANLLKQNGIAPDFFYTSNEQEAIALNRADIIIAIQEEEANYYRSITKAKVAVISHVVFEPTWQWSMATRANKPLRIGYFGSGNSFNRKSMEGFIAAYCQNESLMAKSELIFAGSICNHLQFPQEINKTLMGKVDKITDFYREVDIAINPMIAGTGLKIKTVEAFSFGVPIVSTISGSDGLPVEQEYHLARSPQQMVSYLLAMTQPQQLAMAGKESSKIINKYKYQLTQQLDLLGQTIQIIQGDRAEQKTVVVVTEAPFWEGNNGKHERILSLCNEIKQHSSLKVFFLGSIWQARQQEIDAQGYGGMVVSFKDYEQGELPEDLPPWTEFYNVPGLNRWRHSAFYRAFAKFIAIQKPNMVILEYIYLSYLKDAIPDSCTAVLDTHDIMSFREYRFYEHGFDHHINISLGEEKRILEQFDAVVAIQKEERQLLQKILPQTPVLLCPHVVNTEVKERNNYAIKTIGFIGGSSLANRVGLEWFLHQVWSVIKPFNLELLIFGSVGEQFNEYCGKDLQVKNMGMGMSQAEIYQAIDCAINPIFVGGGLKIKTLEAIAYGKPIVSTKEGAVGIGEAGNNGIMLARDRAEFIEAFIRLVNEPNLVRELIEQGQQLIKSDFNSTVAYHPLLQLAKY